MAGTAFSSRVERNIWGTRQAQQKIEPRERHTLSLIQGSENKSRMNQSYCSNQKSQISLSSQYTSAVQEMKKGKSKQQLYKLMQDRMKSSRHVQLLSKVISQ